MGVDYVVDLSCPVKADLPTAALIGLVKSRNMAAIVLERSQQDDDPQPPSAIQVGRLHQTPHGDTIQNVSLQDLIDEGARLHGYEHYCIGCPANVLGEPFGCYGYLAYPIPAAAEEWLMARLPDALDSTAGRLLQAGIADFNYNGDTIRDMRRQGMFFDRGKAVERSWRTGLMRRWTLTSDQVLHMMIGLGNLQSAHCGLLVLFLGAVPHDTPADLLRDREAWRQTLRQVRLDVSEEDTSIHQWVSFVNALAIAAALGVQVLLDR